jgi:predicted Ser/Thr protein kinase
MEVQRGLKMSAIDIVASPSAPDAFVQGLMEGHDFVWDTMNEDVQFVEQLRIDIQKTSSRNLQEAKLAAFQKFMQNIRTK